MRKALAVPEDPEPRDHLSAPEDPRPRVLPLTPYRPWRPSSPVDLGARGLPSAPARRYRLWDPGGRAALAARLALLRRSARARAEPLRAYRRSGARWHETFAWRTARPRWRAARGPQAAQRPR